MRHFSSADVNFTRMGNLIERRFALLPPQTYRRKDGTLRS